MMEFATQCTIELVDGLLPKRQTYGAAAYDLYCPKDTIIRLGRQVIPLGFRMSFPVDLEAQIEARSGFEVNGFEGYWIGDSIMDKPCRFDADVLAGKIDSDYRGIVGVIVKSYEKIPFVCKAGTRIAQMTFVRIDHPELVVGQVDETSRGSGGYGSTGTHR